MLSVSMRFCSHFAAVYVAVIVLCRLSHFTQSFLHWHFETKTTTTCKRREHWVATATEHQPQTTDKYQFIYKFQGFFAGKIYDRSFPTTHIRFSMRATIITVSTVTSSYILHVCAEYFTPMLATPMRPINTVDAEG